MLKATNINHYVAEEIEELPSDTVLISINEEDEPAWNLKIDRNSNKLLTVKFSDITAKQTIHGRTYSPISQETALKILNFINLNKDKNIIINCTAGISRSGAVALYLHLFHGYELKPNFWKLSMPNKYVLGALILARFQDK